MWIKALFYAAMCRWRPAVCLLVKMLHHSMFSLNLDIEDVWIPPFLLFSLCELWSLCDEWATTCGLFPPPCFWTTMRCGWFRFFCCISLCLYGSNCLWFGETSVLESVKLLNLWPQAVWMSVGCGSVFGSTLDFCHQCFICFRILYFWLIVLFILAFCIVSELLFFYWCHFTVERGGNTVFSFCSSSHIYLNMMSMFFLFVLIPCSSVGCSKPEVSRGILSAPVLFSGGSSPFLFFFLHWLHPDAFLLYRLQPLMQWAARNGTKMVYYHIV